LQQKSNSLIELLLHQDQREHLPELTGNIFNPPAGDEGVSLIDALKADMLLLCNKKDNSLIKLLLHQDQREHLPKLTSDIFNPSTRDKAMSFVEAVKAEMLLL
jgi:hypothetical protein